MNISVEKEKMCFVPVLQVEYNIRKCAFTPYTSCELSYSLNEIGAFEKLRWTLGTEWKLSKKHALDFLLSVSEIRQTTMRQTGM